MLSNAPIAVVVPVVNLDESVQFYANVLGLRQSMSGEGLVAFEAGQGTQIVLYARSTPTTADHTVASFAVADIEAEVKALAAQGVVFEQYDFPGLQTNELGIAATGNSFSAWFKDPAGNILAVSQIN